MATQETESKVEIIKVGSTGPLAFFALVVVVALGGIFGSLTLIDDATLRTVVTLSAIILIIIMVIFAGLKLLSKSGRNVEYPSHGSLLGDLALTGFYEGGDSKKLEGTWEVVWQSFDEKGKLLNYTAKDPDTGEEKPYPPEEVRITVKGALVSVNAIDKVTRFNYYMEGRISTKNIVTLVYWSRAKEKQSILVGVLLLELQESYQSGLTMSGSWSGYTGRERIEQGRVIWKKITR